MAVLSPLDAIRILQFLVKNRQLAVALGTLSTKFASTTLAGRMAVVYLRTVGWVFNQTGLSPIPGIGTRTAAERLIPTVFPIPFPVGAFLRGFAYRDSNQVATGWLSFFGELLLSPVVEGNLEEATKAAGRGDIIGFFNAAGQAFTEDVGLGTIAAFFRGTETLIQDIATIAPGLGIPSNPVGEAVIYLDGFFRTFGSSIARFLGLGGPPPKPGERPVMDPLPLDPAFRNRLRDIEAEAKKKKGDTREVARAARRLVRIFPIGEIIRKAKPSISRLARLIFALAN